MRMLTVVTFKIMGLVLPSFCVVLGLFFLSSLLGHHRAEAHGRQIQELMYVVETSGTGTYQVGKPWDINIVLYHNRKRADKYSDALKEPGSLTITVTTLETLEGAKRALPPRQSRSTGFDENKLVLGRGQQVAQITIKREKGEFDKDARVTCHQSGLIHIFAESAGVATGDTVIVVGNPKRAARAYSESSSLSSGLRLLPVAMQPDSPDALRLEINPSQPNVKIHDGEQVAFFRVMLKSVARNEFVYSPQNLHVVLEVVASQGRWEPNEPLEMPRDKMFTTNQAALRTKAGGKIWVRASVGNATALNISPHETAFEFNSVPHTTHLLVTPVRQGAVANGVDEVELKVEARQDQRIILPEEEGLEERVINFRLLKEAPGVRFKNGSEVRIPKGQQNGTIVLVGTLPAGGVNVVAETRNGLNDPISTINNPTRVRFSFPLLQLLCAAIGGGVFPLLWRQTKTIVATGVVLGAVFFGLALFGAIAASSQNLGLVPITVTSLSTEAPFASFILGLIGSVLIGSVFVQPPGTGGAWVLAPGNPVARAVNWLQKAFRGSTKQKPDRDKKRSVDGL